MSRFYTNSGSPIKINKVPKFNDEGIIILEDGEKTDFQAYIDSFRQETDIQTIISRFVNGDTNALSRAQGFYGDCKDIPTNYADILNMVNEGKRAFDLLPVEIKQEFDNDFNKWFATMGTDSWFKTMEYSVKNDIKEESEEGGIVSE